MSPDQIAEKYARVKLGGAEAALVLALLFGPRSKARLWRELPHHRDTLADALKKLVARGDVIVRPGPRTQLALAASRALAFPAQKETATESTGSCIDAEKTPRPNAGVFMDRPEKQRIAVLARLKVPEDLVKTSPLMQDRAENLARQMFGK